MKNKYNGNSEIPAASNPTPPAFQTVRNDDRRARDCIPGATGNPLITRWMRGMHCEEENPSEERKALGGKSKDKAEKFLKNKRGKRREYPRVQRKNFETARAVQFHEKQC